MGIAHIVNLLFEIYFWIIIVRIFLTWIPSIDWSTPPFNLLRAAGDIILNPFRKIIPPLGGLDFSPIIALFFLQFVQYAVVRMLVIAGL